MKTTALILTLLLASFARGDGTVPLEDSYYFTFNTVAPSTGAPITLGGTPAIEVYEEVTDTQITAGDTLDVDFDSVTGLHHVTLACTAANGYESGKWYTAVIAGTTPTADSVSVAGRTVARFRVVAQETTAGIPKGDAELVEGADPDTVFSTLQELVDGILDEPLSGHTTSGTVAKAISDILGDTTAMNDTTRSEPGQGAPAATTTLATKIDYLYKAWRNKSTVTDNGDGTSTYKLYSDDVVTVDQKSTNSDDNTTYTKGENATGP